MMRMHVLAVNLMESGWWSGTLAEYGKDYRRAVRRFLGEAARGEAGGVLTNTMGFPVVGGWHFSWLGGPDGMRSKIRSSAPPGLPNVAVIDAHAERMYRERISPLGGDRLLEVVVDDTFPRYMQERRGPADWYWPGTSVPEEGET